MAGNVPHISNHAPATKTLASIALAQVSGLSPLPSEEEQKTSSLVRR